MFTVATLIVTFAQRDYAATRDFVVVGGGGGFAFQALLGAWSFLLPSTRPPVPKRRRVELVAMELGGRLQVVAYNLGLVTLVLGLRAAVDVSRIGIVLVWTAGVWAIAKSWAFPSLSRLATVERLSAEWWSEPKETRA
jgi:hypothetical protein